MPPMIFPAIHPPHHPSPTVVVWGYLNAFCLQGDRHSDNHVYRSSDPRIVHELVVVKTPFSNKWFVKIVSCPICFRGQHSKKIILKAPSPSLQVKDTGSSNKLPCWQFCPKEVVISSKKTSCAAKNVMFGGCRLSPPMIGRVNSHLTSYFGRLSNLSQKDRFLAEHSNHSFVLLCRFSAWFQKIILETSLLLTYTPWN